MQDSNKQRRSKIKEILGLRSFGSSAGPICDWYSRGYFQFNFNSKFILQSQLRARDVPVGVLRVARLLVREPQERDRHKNQTQARSLLCKGWILQNVWDDWKLWSMHHSIVLRGGSLTGRWLGDRRYLVPVRKPGRSIAWRSARSRLSQHLLQSICQGCTSPPFGPVLHFETMARTRGRYQQKLKVATSNDIFKERQNA